MMVATFRFVLAAVSLVIAVSLPAEAKHRTGMHQIGILWPVEYDQTLEAFRQELQQLGYIEGKNVALEYRSSRGNDALLPDLAAELVRLDVDLIVTWGVTAGRATRQATTTIPVVNGSMSDPVRAKLADSLARPGGNITGLTSANPQVSAKRLQLIQELIPGVSRVAVLATAAPTATFARQETEAAGRLLGIGIQSVIVERPDELEAAYEAMARERAEALIVLPDLMFDQHRQRVIELASVHRLPAMYYGLAWVEAGGLMSYGLSFAEMFRRAARYADRILKGASPADLPIEQPVDFELHINLKTAHHLGLKLPPPLLIRAARLVE